VGLLGSVIGLLWEVAGFEEASSFFAGVTVLGRAENSASFALESLLIFLAIDISLKWRCCSYYVPYTIRNHLSSLYWIPAYAGMSGI